MRFVVTNIDVDPLSVSFEVVRQGGVELVLIGLVSHVPDGVVVRLDVGKTEGSSSGECRGQCKDHEADRPLDNVWRDPVLEDELAGPRPGPAGRVPVRSGRDLPRLPLLVKHQAGNEEGDGEEEQKDDSDPAKVAEPS